MANIDYNKYLEAALETTNFITYNEIVTEQGKYWDTIPDVRTQNEKISFFDPKSYYGGSAGIGTYFIRLYQVTKDEKWLDEAKEAAKYIINTYEGVRYYKEVFDGSRRGTFGFNGWTIGVFSGPIGSGLFLVELYKITRDEQYLEYAKKIADDILTISIRGERGIHFTDEFDLNGDGSVLYYLLLLYRTTQNTKYLDAASDIGDYIVDKAIEAKEGGVYFDTVNLSKIGFGFDDGDIFPNFYHGTSGIAYLLANLYKDSGDALYLEYAKKAVDFLKAIAVGDEEYALVPYLYSPVTGPKTEIFYLSTCHGPVGTSIAFRELYNITGEKEYLDWVVRLSKGIIKSGAPSINSSGYWNSYCQCCGAPGVLEHFVEMYELTGDELFLRKAVETADILIGDSFYERKIRTRKWYAAWTRVKPYDVQTYTGLYVGAAGCASSLIRLYSQKDKLKLSPIFDYALS